MRCRGAFFAYVLVTVACAAWGDTSGEARPVEPVTPLADTGRVTGGNPNLVPVLPGQSIQVAVEGHPPGTVFLIKAGTHVRQTVIPKPGNVFQGEPGAVLDGQGVSRWAFRGWNGVRWVDSVVIRGLTITRYKPPVQDGAVAAGNAAGDAGSSWVVEGNEICYNDEYGVRIGDRMRIVGNRLHHNLRLNVGGGGTGTVVERNEIAYGNYLRLYEIGFEAGGTKFAATTGLIVRDNHVHHNTGPGVWTDIDNIDVVIEGNRVEDNATEGIVHEIGYRATIRDNVVRNNGWADPAGRRWLWNAGIAIHASSDVDVHGNTLVGNFNGIVAIQQRRGSGRYGPYVVQNLYVHDNIITQTSPQSAFPPYAGNVAAGVAQDTGDDAIFTSRNNRFQNNTYYLLPVAPGNSPGFEWAGGWKTDRQWRALGHDVSGRFERQ